MTKKQYQKKSVKWNTRLKNKFIGQTFTDACQISPWPVLLGSSVGMIQQKVQVKVVVKLV